MDQKNEQKAPLRIKNMAELKRLSLIHIYLDVDVPNYIQFLRESSTLDVDSMKWDMEDRNLKMTRPAFGGHLMADVYKRQRLGRSMNFAARTF